MKRATSFILLCRLDEFCRRAGLDPDRTTQVLERSRAVLLKRRSGRIRPLRDDKVITSWNGLMIAALARVGVVCGKPEYLERAGRAATFILGSMRRDDGRLLRSYLNTPSEIPAFLEDYAFLALGMLELYEATLDTRWLDEANLLAQEMLRLFQDPESGKFTLTGRDAEQMPIRVSSDHDGVTPSAFSVTAQLLLRLSWICEKPELADAARSALAGCPVELERNPLGHLGALQVLSLLDTEAVVATFAGAKGCPELAAMLRELKLHKIPNLAIRLEYTNENPSVSICAIQTCHPAVTDSQQLAGLLKRIGLYTKRCELSLGACLT